MATIYLFLFQVVLLIWRDLRRVTEVEPKHPKMAGRLIVVSPGATSYEPGFSFPLYGDTTIGRGPENNLVLSDGFVSSRHAILSLRDGQWWLSDLGSKNGSWVNGERVTGEVQVAPGDVITLGQVRLKLAP